MAGRLDALRKLRALCQVSHKTARAALKTSGGDVENALRALIIAGEVGGFELDPRCCTDEHFAWAEIRRSIRQREVMPRSQRRWFREKRPTNVLRKQLHGKTPLDKTSMSLGAFHRQLYLRNKYPELAKKAPPITWRHPVLGRFKCDHDEMEGSILVPGFKAFGSPRSSGKLSLIFPARKRGNTPTKQQVDRVLKLLANSKPLTRTICHAIWRDFQGQGPKTGMWWHGHLDQVNAGLKQPIRREGDLPARLRPYNLTLGSKGEPWVMINFHADYEEEHGVGVLTNGTRVLGIGYSTDVTPYKR